MPPTTTTSTVSTKPTLGLTGLTINAMALIAPGAFLWLTFQIQSLYGAPMAGCAMWAGIALALVLCYATAISYRLGQPFVLLGLSRMHGRRHCADQRLSAVPVLS